MVLAPRCQEKEGQFHGGEICGLELRASVESSSGVFAILLSRGSLFELSWFIENESMPSG